MSTTTHTLLSGSDVSTITNGLRVAAERFDEHAGEFELIAGRLDAGESYPMFASGPGGVIAAERLRDQFKRQANDSRDLITRIEETGGVALVPDEDD